MNEHQPLVSIITPAYNAEKYIKETIESVLGQTYKNWELIVVNDGSTDDTEEIIRSFDDPRVVLLSQKNSGVSSARNLGIQSSKGEYITFLDADDVLPPESLSVRVQYLESHPDVDLVDGNISIKDADIKNDIGIYEPYYEGLLLPRLLALDSRVFFNVCYMFKKEILEGTRFEETMTHAEDLLFYMETASRHSVRYGFVPETIYWYRRGHTSAMANLSGLEDGYLRLIQEVKKLQNISKTDFLIFKTKIAKIMFLSWLSQKESRNAVKSIFRLLFGAK